jgi:hypothetical protein
MDERTFCCPACRLLQSPGIECAECGVAIGEIEASSALLHYRTPGEVVRRKAGIRSAIAGVGVATGASVASVVLLGPIAWAALPVIAYGSILGAGILAGIRDRRYRGMVGIDISEPAIGQGAIERAGIARPLTGPVASTINDKTLLAEHIVIRDGNSVLLRRVHATPFVIGTEPDALVILGEVRLATPATILKKVRTTLPLFIQLGIPAGLLPKHVTVELHQLLPGDAITVRGVVEDATVPELAYHREGGQAHAMHGRRGSLVVVRAG